MTPTVRVSRTVRRRHGGHGGSLAGHAMLAPALLVVAAVTLFPIGYAIDMSLSHVDLGLTGVHLRFDGFHNYSVVFQSPQFWQSLLFTVAFTAVTVVLEFALGLLLALLCKSWVRPRGALMSLFLVPWAFITVVSAELWGYMLNGSYGLMDAVMQGLHLAQGNVVWLGTPTLAAASLMAADVWKTTPFVALMLLAGLLMIPDEIYEASDMDGAGPGATFFRITLPLLRPSMLLALLFRTLQAFGVFDLPFVMTGGGPGSSTQSLSMLAYNAMFRDFDFGPGTAVAVLTVVVVFLMSLVIIAMFRGQLTGTYDA